MTHFRQIPDLRSNSFAYLLADLDKREAVLIDPASEQATLYLALLDELQVRLTHLLLTHLHAPAAPTAEILCRRTGACLAAGAQSGLKEAERLLNDGEHIVFGDQMLRVWATPGHTRGCISYQWRDRVFSGDTLLNGACGASSAAGGNPGALFDSLSRLLTLPDETLVYPAHDFSGRRVSCIGDAREKNPRLTGITRDEFIRRERQVVAPEYPKQLLPGKSI